MEPQKHNSQEKTHHLPSLTNPKEVDYLLCQLLRDPSNYIDQVNGENPLNFAAIEAKLSAVITAKYIPADLPATLLELNEKHHLPLIGSERSVGIPDRLSNILIHNPFSQSNKEVFNDIFSNPFCALTLGRLVLGNLLFAPDRNLDSIELKKIFSILEENLIPRAVQGIRVELFRSLINGYPHLEFHTERENFDLYARGLLDYPQLTEALFFVDHAKITLSYILSSPPSPLSMELTPLLEHTCGKALFEGIDLYLFTDWLKQQLLFHRNDLEIFAKLPPEKKVRHSNEGEIRIHNFSDTINFLIFASEDFIKFKDAYVENDKTPTKSRWVPRALTSCTDRLLKIFSEQKNQRANVSIVIDPLLPRRIGDLFKAFFFDPDEFSGRFYSNTLPNALNGFAKSGDLRSCISLSSLYPPIIGRSSRSPSAWIPEVLTDYIIEEAPKLHLAVQQKCKTLADWIDNPLGQQLLAREHGFAELKNDIRSLSDFISKFIAPNTVIFSSESIRDSCFSQCLKGFSLLFPQLVKIDHIRYPNRPLNGQRFFDDYPEAFNQIYKILAALPNTETRTIAFSQALASSNMLYTAFCLTIISSNSESKAHLKGGSAAARKQGEIFETDLERISQLFSWVAPKLRDKLPHPRETLELLNLSRRGRGIRSLLQAHSDWENPLNVTISKTDMECISRAAELTCDRTGMTKGQLSYSRSIIDGLRIGVIQLSPEAINLSFEESLEKGIRLLGDLKEQYASKRGAYIRDTAFNAEDSLFISMLFAIKEGAPDNIIRAIGALRDLYTIDFENYYTTKQQREALQDEFSAFISQLKAIPNLLENQKRTIASIKNAVESLKEQPYFKNLQVELGLE